MNIEPETPVYKQIEGFIRTAEKKWDNPITKIVMAKILSSNTRKTFLYLLSRRTKVVCF